MIKKEDLVRKVGEIIQNNNTTDAANILLGIMTNAIVMARQSQTENPVTMRQFSTYTSN